MLDACHLKGPYGGQLIAAVARDPNEEYFPLAFVVVEAETYDSWSWFLKLLDSNGRRMTYVSYQQKVYQYLIKFLFAIWLIIPSI